MLHNGGDSPAISGCVLARDEASRIEGALECLQGWADEIVVIDNGSVDRTAEIARGYTDRVVSYPPAASIGTLRNLAAEHAAGEWILYLDADERMPAPLRDALRWLVGERGREFAAFYVPFHRYFCGRWMRHSGWGAPGHGRPQLLRKGAFHFSEIDRAGVQIEGRGCFLPADAPDYAVTHLCCDDLSHYLTKLNRDTDEEAERLRAEGASHSWQAQLTEFVRGWQARYGVGQGYLDGMHGFVLALMEATGQLIGRAKAWDLRRKHGEIDAAEAVPGSLAEVLAFMAEVALRGDDRWLARSPSRLPSPSGATAPAEPPSAGGEIASAGDRGREEPCGITACIVARNEERRIEGALRSLRGWVDRIIVVDNQSDDRTAEIARRYADVVLTAPRGPNFEAVRLSVAGAIDAAAFETGDWIFYLDADERVSPRLGEALRALVRAHGEEFEAVCVPFRSRCYGKWMESPVWWPGYKGPQLLKKGSFRYGERIHSGALVRGRVVYLPGGDPGVSAEHLAYDDIAHCLAKFNVSTSDAGELLDRDGESHSWQSMLTRFVSEWHLHYDRGQAYVDGMHGFVHAFMCAFYHLASYAKLWDRRRKVGATSDHEPVPRSLDEVLEFMSRMLEDARRQPLPGRAVRGSGTVAQLGGGGPPDPFRP